MLYAYHLSPIDFGWEYVPTVEEVIRKMLNQESPTSEKPDYDLIETSENIRMLTSNLQIALEIAKEVGWEGDFRRGATPRVLFMPDEMRIIHAFVWKQDNNGSTFVVSPVQLPWLMEDTSMIPIKVTPQQSFEF